MEKIMTAEKRIQSNPLLISNLLFIGAAKQPPAPPSKGDRTPFQEFDFFFPISPLK
jgi:hypothetical protein